jgi:hypothetical protein
MFKAITIIVAILGVGTVFAGFIIGLQNSGSCPAQEPGCDHTFPGTDIRIGATATVVTTIGLLILAVSLVIGATYYAMRLQASHKFPV